MITELKMKLYRDGELIGVGWFTTWGNVRSSEHGTKSSKKAPDNEYGFFWRRSPVLPWTGGTNIPLFDKFTVDCYE